MPGELIKVNDYNFNTKRRQITNQNTYFNERFGRSDFDEIKDPRRKGDAPAYLLKYIEKTGEKIVYSKGLPQFVKSDIREEDIITAMGKEDNKLLLYDDLTCIDERRHLYQDKHTPCSQMSFLPNLRQYISVEYVVKKFFRKNDDLGMYGGI